MCKSFKLDWTTIRGGSDYAHASCVRHRGHLCSSARACQRILISITTLILGANELGAQPAPARMFEWAKGLFATSVHFDCVDPWQCYAAVTTVTRGGLTVHDVLDVTNGGVFPYSSEGSITSKPVFSPCCRIYSFVVAPGVFCLETREGLNENPVVWTKRGYSEFQKSELQESDRVLWGKSAEGELSRVSFTRGPATESGHALLLSMFRTDRSTLDKRIPLEKLRRSDPIIFNDLWWSDAFTILSNDNLLFVNARVGPTHSEIDSTGRATRDSVEARLSYFLLDANNPEKSRFGSADLDKASLGSVPASMGCQAKCLKNSQDEIWFLVETQGYRDPSDRTGFRDTSVTSLTLVSFVIDEGIVSIGSNSHPRLTPSTQITEPIHRVVSIQGEDTIDGIKTIDIGKDGSIFIDEL